MVSSVNTNVNAMAAIASLNAISSQMTDTQGAIESGLKVGSAADNPAVFTIAQGLRGNVQALQAVSDSLATGIATVQGQTAGATSISDTLNTLLQTVTQAQNQTGAALASSNSTITAALANIDAYAQASTINNVNLLATAGSVNVLSNVNGTNTVATTANASTSAGLGLTNLAVSSVGATMTSESSLTLTAAATAGDTATYTSSAGVATTYTYSATPVAANNQIAIDATGVSLKNAINATYGGANVSGSGTLLVTGGGSLVGSSANYVQANPGATTADTVTFQATNSPNITTFTLVTTLTGAANEVAIGNSGAQTMSNLAGAMQQDGISASASFGKLTAVGGALVSSANGAAHSPVVNATNGAASIALVNNAINLIGKTLSSLGSATTTLQGLASFTSSLSTSVTTSLGAMVDANLSQESAMLSSLQTKQSLAIQSLSLANPGPGALLQLFR